jgi:hypothetical protein
MALPHERYVTVHNGSTIIRFPGQGKNPDLALPSICETFV